MKERTERPSGETNRLSRYEHTETVHEIRKPKTALRVEYLREYKNYLRSNCHKKSNGKSDFLDHALLNLTNRLNVVRIEYGRFAHSKSHAASERTECGKNKSIGRIAAKKRITCDYYLDLDRIANDVLTKNYVATMSSCKRSAVFDLSAINAVSNNNVGSCPSSKEFKKRREINRMRCERQRKRNKKKTRKRSLKNRIDASSRSAENNMFFPERDLKSEQTDMSEIPRMDGPNASPPFASRVSVKAIDDDNNDDDEGESEGEKRERDNAIDEWTLGTPLPKDSYKKHPAWESNVAHLDERNKRKLEETLDALGDDGRHQMPTPLECLNWAKYVRNKVSNYFKDVKKEDCIVSFLPELELMLDRRIDMCTLVGFLHMVTCGPMPPDGKWTDTIRCDVPFISCEEVKSVKFYRASKSRCSILEKVPESITSFYRCEKTNEAGKFETLKDSSYSSFYFASLNSNGTHHPTLSDNFSTRPTVSKLELKEHRSKDHSAHLLNRNVMTREQTNHFDLDEYLPEVHQLSKLYSPFDTDVIYLNAAAVSMPEAFKKMKKAHVDMETHYSNFIKCYRIRLLYNATPCHWRDFDRFGAKHRDYSHYDEKAVTEKFVSRTKREDCDGLVRKNVEADGDRKTLYFNGDYEPKSVDDLLKLTKEYSSKNNLRSNLKVNTRCDKKRKKPNETINEARMFECEQESDKGRTVERLFAHSKTVSEKKPAKSSTTSQPKEKRKRKRCGNDVTENGKKNIKRNREPVSKRCRFDSETKGNRDILEMFMRNKVAIERRIDVDDKVGTDSMHERST